MLKLVIANKLYSSWSLRPWMVMRAFDVAFEEVLIPLRRPESRPKVLTYSPSGKVPALVTPHGTIWESMAIIEYVAESFPHKPIWPVDKRARAHARAISNEMHGGFQTLRGACPMDLGSRYATPEITVPLKANIDRIETIWQHARAHFGAGGPFLFGEFSAADAMYAPVVSRFETYQIDVSRTARAYMDAVLSHPAFVEWRNAAVLEPWSIDDYASGHKLVHSYR